MFEVAGWAGATLVLVAYAIVTKRGPSVGYHLLNIVGASALLANTLHHRALAPTALNAVWCLLALRGVAVASRPSQRGVIDAP